MAPAGHHGQRPSSGGAGLNPAYRLTGRRERPAAGDLRRYRFNERCRAGRCDVRSYWTTRGVIAAVIGPCLALSACAGQPDHWSGDTTCDGTIEGVNGTPLLHHGVVSHRAARRTSDAGTAGGGVQRGPAQVQVKLIDIPEASYPPWSLPPRRAGTCRTSSTSTGRTSTTTRSRGSSSRSTPASRQPAGRPAAVDRGSRAATPDGCRGSARSTPAWASTSARRSCTGSGPGSRRGGRRLDRQRVHQDPAPAAPALATGSRSTCR